MDKILRNQIDELKTIAPDAAWREHAKHQLLQQIEGSARQTPSAGWSIVAHDTAAAWFATAARPAYALAAMALVMFAGGLFSISAASEATPGSMLYTVKLVGEKTQFALVRKPEERMRLHAVLAERRAQELTQVVTSDAARAGAVALSLMNEVEEIKAKLGEIERDQPQAALAIAREVEVHTRQLREQLESAKQTVAQGSQSTNDTLDAALYSVDQTELAALRAIAKGQSTGDADEDEAIQREVARKVADKIAQTKEKIAATEEGLDAVVSAGLGRSDRSISVATPIQALAQSKTQAASASIAEAEAFLKEANVTEALDKLTQGEELLAEANVAAQEAEQQAATPEETGETTTTPAAEDEATGTVEGVKIQGEQATTTAAE